MIKDIGEDIALFISQQLETENLGFGYQQSDYKIVSTNLTERQFIGLDDNLLDCSYVRFLSDSINTSLAKMKIGACQKNFYTESVMLRAVYASDTHDNFTQIDMLQSALIKAKAEFPQIKNFEIEIRVKHFATESVIEMETKHETWNNQISVICIDFMLSYDILY